MTCSNYPNRSSCYWNKKDLAFNKSKKNKGFTLIELIVVVSIILILSGFLVPKVIGYQDKAKKAKVVNTARQIFDTSMESFTEEEGNFDATKVFDSISKVTGLPASTTKVTGGTDTATIIFESDSKTYDVVITSADNKFIVNQVTVAASVPTVTSVVYTNK